MPLVCIFRILRLYTVSLLRSIGVTLQIDKSTLLICVAGIAWRHFFGPNGPRPPPVLHMWPTKEVGAVHQVDSLNGFW